MSSDLSSFPVLPHGGILVDRIVSAEEAVALRQLASERPALRLDARELADLELIATGAASPLTGFLTESDYASVVEKLRLANGTVWPLPLTLAVPDESKKDVVPGAIVALEDASGRLWGVIEVKQVFERDPLHEARHSTRISVRASEAPPVQPGPQRERPLPRISIYRHPGRQSSKSDVHRVGPRRSSLCSVPG